jgi:hypothetical protein
MSDATPPTDPNALLFPVFVYGEHATCRRKMKAEAKRWAKRYEERGDFPEPKLIPVPPGSVMILEGVEADMIAFGAGSRKLCWFFYLVDWLRMHANPGSPAVRAIFQPKFEAFACRYPWGALSVAISPWDSSIHLVTQRLEAVLSFWEKLDTLRYLRLRQYTLTELMLFFYEATIRMWVDAPTGTVRDMLRATIERMRNASEDEIAARMMRQFYQVADTDPKLTHREWLKSPGVIEAELVRIKQTWPAMIENLKTDSMGAQSGFLSELEKKYPNG